jgi:archaellum component FlaC
VIENDLAAIASRITGLCSQASAKIPEIHRLERNVWVERQMVRAFESVLAHSNQALTDAGSEIERLSTEVPNLSIQLLILAKEINFDDDCHV